MRTANCCILAASKPALQRSSGDVIKFWIFTLNAMLSSCGCSDRRNAPNVPVNVVFLSPKCGGTSWKLISGCFLATSWSVKTPKWLESLVCYNRVQLLLLWWSFFKIWKVLIPGTLGPEIPEIPADLPGLKTAEIKSRADRSRSSEVSDITTCKSL